VHQVELHVPSAAQQLEAPLALAVRLVAVAAHQRPVCLGQHSPYIHDEREQRLGVETRLTRPQVVEEDAARAPPLVLPVRVHEIVIAPALESGIEARVMARAHRRQRTVKVNRVLSLRPRRG
jgi:hypothetical protein